MPIMTIDNMQHSGQTTHKDVTVHSWSISLSRQYSVQSHHTLADHHTQLFPSSSTSWHIHPFWSMQMCTVISYNNQTHWDTKKRPRMAAASLLKCRHAHYLTVLDVYHTVTATAYTVSGTSQTHRYTHTMDEGLTITCIRNYHCVTHCSAWP